MRRILALSVLIMFLCSACVELGDDYPGGPRTLARQNREIQTAMAERQKRIDEENRQKNAKVDARRKRVAEFKEERQEKFKIMEAELKDQYLSEYLKNDRFQYVVTSVNYDEIINTLVAKAKLNPQIDSSKY